jgi:hypothetical protein
MTKPIFLLLNSCIMFLVFQGKNLDYYSKDLSTYTASEIIDELHSFSDSGDVVMVANDLETIADFCCIEVSDIHQPSKED